MRRGCSGLAAYPPLSFLPFRVAKTDLRFDGDEPVCEPGKGHQSSRGLGP
jgi:hypothetical protein